MRYLQVPCQNLKLRIKYWNHLYTDVFVIHVIVEKFEERKTRTNSKLVKQQIRAHFHITFNPAKI